MITIKGELYSGDPPTREPIEKSFAFLDYIWDYLFDHTHGILKSENSDFGTVDFGTCYADFKAGIVCNRSTVNAMVAKRAGREDTRVIIHEIETDEGVIFSDGVYTEGFQHASMSYVNWARATARYLIDKDRERFRFVP